jgi:acyl carrier protein
MLTELWESVLHPAVVPPDQRLHDLGGDSTAAARIILGVRRLFGISIPFRLLPEVDTVRSMAAHIAAVRANGDAA